MQRSDDGHAVKALGAIRVATVHEQRSKVAVAAKDTRVLVDAASGSKNASPATHPHTAEPAVSGSVVADRRDTRPGRPDGKESTPR